MISRSEFYSCVIMISAVIIFTASYFDHQTTEYEIEKARLEFKDSIYQTQRDSALSIALQREYQADSLKSVINRRKLDISNIKKKYENEKRAILDLNADSTLSFFERSTY